MIAEAMGSSRHRGTLREISKPEDIPLFDLVPVSGANGRVIDSYRGVQCSDTGEVVSVVSDRYGLVQHRHIASAICSIGASLDKPESDTVNPGVHFRPMSIRLYANGRRMEVKLVIGQKFRIDAENEFYPAVRVLNSLDGSWAVRVEAFGVRIACTNQLYAGARSFMEFRELHLSSPHDLLGQMEKAIYNALDRFDGALDLYASSMGKQMSLSGFLPALEGAGIPHRHALSMAEGLPEYFGSTLWGQESRWDLYQIATSYLTHRVSGRVNPERERQFERAAARALLLEGTGEVWEAVPA